MVLLDMMQKIYVVKKIHGYSANRVLLAHVVGGAGLVGPGGVGGNGPVGCSPEPGPSSTLFIFVVFSLKIFAYTLWQQQ